MAALPSPEDIKLIITDVDGTLLTSEHTIHPRTLSAITKLRATRPNLPIVIASGKQHNSCHWIRHALRLPQHFPATHCNGALIYGGLSGGLLSEFSASLPPAVIAHIVESSPQFGTFVFTEDEAILVSPGIGVHKKEWCEIAARYDKGVRNCSEDPDRSQFLRQITKGECIVPKITLCCDPSNIDSAKCAIDAIALNSPLPFKVTRAIPWIFEAVGLDVHKGQALMRICKDLQVTPKQVLAFGDGENDIEMLCMAASSVAMGNAMPATMAAARYMTTSNDEGGVGEFIEKVWEL